MRVVIADDEPLARETLRLLLSPKPEVEIVAECENGPQAVAAIREHRPEIAFLDVQMPGLDGLGVVREVGSDHMPVVVFVTAYDQYAVDAFAAQALDYLLKPFDDERFEHAFRRASERVSQGESAEIAKKLARMAARLESDGGLARKGSGVDSPARDATTGKDSTGKDTARKDTARKDTGLANSAPLERIMVKDRDSVVFVDTASIDWIEAAGDYVTLHVGSAKHLIRESMTTLEEALDRSRFVRIHRSTIVNIDRVRELKPYFHGDYIVYLEDGTERRLSRRYWKNVEALAGRG